MRKRLSKTEAEKAVAILIHIATSSWNAGNYKEASEQFLKVAKFLHNWNMIVVPEKKGEKNGKPKVLPDLPKTRDPTNISPFNPEDSSR